VLTLRKQAGAIGVSPRERTLREYLRFGVALVDKPCGPSSHETSAFARKILASFGFGVEKTGHSGTLDPDVSGVLPVMLGDACKASGFLSKERKKYVCVTRFEKPVNEKQIEKAFSRFRGKIYQTPPLASAVARRLRIREVFSLELLELDESKRFALFECDVEAGFYVRKLVEDLSNVLNNAGVMAELRRTEAAGFREEQCVTLQELSDRAWLARERGEEAPLRACVIPIEEAIRLKKVVVDDEALRPITTGANVAIPGICAFDEGIEKGEAVQILSLKGELACFAHALLSSGEIRKKRGGLAFDVSRVIHAF
jgi:H/ACA ribonucleoprotein complex subunit 4